MNHEMEPNTSEFKFIEMRNDKKQYIAPQLTVVTFKAEQGYANSPQTRTAIFLYLLQPEENYNVNSAQQNWIDGHDLFSW
jgi:hypothetical protein